MQVPELKLLNFSRDYISEPPEFKDINESKLRITDPNEINELRKIYEANKAKSNNFALSFPDSTIEFATKANSLLNALKGVQQNKNIEMHDSGFKITDNLTYYNLEHTEYDNEKSVVSALEFLKSIDRKKEEELISNLESMSVEYKPTFNKDRSNTMNITKSDIQKNKTNSKISKLSFADDLE